MDPTIASSKAEIVNAVGHKGYERLVELSSITSNDLPNCGGLVAYVLGFIDTVQSKLPDMLREELRQSGHQLVAVGDYSGRLEFPNPRFQDTSPSNVCLFMDTTRSYTTHIALHLGINDIAYHLGILSGLKTLGAQIQFREIPWLAFGLNPNTRKYDVAYWVYPSEYYRVTPKD